MSAHTPGPWKVVKYDNNALGISTEETENEICYSLHLRSANARLIAAAHDLLAACKTASKLSFIGEMAAKCKFMLDDAIAKAEGTTT